MACAVVAKGFKYEKTINQCDVWAPPAAAGKTKADKDLKTAPHVR